MTQEANNEQKQKESDNKTQSTKRYIEKDPDNCNDSTRTQSI